MTLTRLDKLSVVDRGSQFVPVSFQVCLWDQQRGIAVREDGIDGHIGHAWESMSHQTMAWESMSHPEFGPL
jgi:hypothetical protein